MGTKLILWLILEISVFSQFFKIVQEQDINIGRKFLAGVIIILGAPAFFVYSALAGLLDLILPEGWDDDEGDML